MECDKIFHKWLIGLVGITEAEVSHEVDKQTSEKEYVEVSPKADAKPEELFNISPPMRMYLEEIKLLGDSAYKRFSLTHYKDYISYGGTTRSIFICTDLKYGVSVRLDGTEGYIECLDWTCVEHCWLTREELDYIDRYLLRDITGKLENKIRRVAQYKAKKVREVFTNKVLKNADNSGELR